MASILRLSSCAVLATLLAVIGCRPSGPAGESPAGELRLQDLEGRWVSPLRSADEQATVFIFVGIECPISNRYAPEIARLYEAYSPRGVRFWLVYTDPDDSVDAIRQHMREYGFPFAALRDDRHELVRRAGVHITPEVALFRAEELLYRGRIDDWYVDFGRVRAAPTQRDLQNALEAELAGQRRPLATTQAIGCTIPPVG